MNDELNLEALEKLEMLDWENYVALRSHCDLDYSYEDYFCRL